VPSVLDRVGRRAEQLQQFLDASVGQALAEEQAAGDGVGADDIPLLVRLVPVGQQHRQFDEGVDAPVELDPVEIAPAQRALDDLRSGQPLVDVALAERPDDRLGVAQQ
jgi:hypothetical protein